MTTTSTTASGARGRLAGKVAWVTGGATGVGQATARWLAQAGATVVISGRRRQELSQTAAALQAEGLSAHAVPLDVADPAAVAAAHASIAARHGAVGVLVCAAGINVPRRSWADLTPEGFAQVVGINLEGVAWCVREVLPGMRAAGDGVIVIVSSWAGWTYLPVAGAAYSASKSALGPLVQSLNDQEGRHGVRVCHLCPAEIATPILKTRPVPPSDEDMARMLKPEDVAETIGFVVSAPPHVCLNEVVIAPTWNRIYIGAEDLKPR